MRDVTDNHLKVMIESMSRSGCSEREIVAAVEEARGRVLAERPAALLRAAGFARRAIGARMFAVRS